MVMKHQMDSIIMRALEEDISYGDITSDVLLDETVWSKGELIAKENGVIAGIDIFKRVFEILDSEHVNVTLLKKDGDLVENKDLIAVLEGPAMSLLKGERTALNILQRMSGIATMANKYAKACEGTKTRIVDTRKTTPGLRILEKYAVTVGGGFNHRYNLSDAVLIKDNHIKAVGDIEEAVKRARGKIPHTMKIEVETETLEQVEQAIRSGADIIMLDNMSNDTMLQAVKMINGRALTEASGNVTEERIKEIAAIGVDIISSGALTHSVKALDISLKF